MSILGNGSDFTSKVIFVGPHACEPLISLSCEHEHTWPIHVHKRYTNYLKQANPQCVDVLTVCVACLCPDSPVWLLEFSARIENHLLNSISSLLNITLEHGLILRPSAHCWGCQSLGMRPVHIQPTLFRFLLPTDTFQPFSLV